MAYPHRPPPYLVTASCWARVTCDSPLTVAATPAYALQSCLAAVTSNSSDKSSRAVAFALRSKVLRKGGPDCACYRPGCTQPHGA